MGTLARKVFSLVLMWFMASVLAWGAAAPEDPPPWPIPEDQAMVPSAILINETFENYIGWPPNWIRYNLDVGPSTWDIQWELSQIEYHSYFHAARTAYSQNGQNDWLVTPVFHIPWEGVLLTFWEYGTQPGPGRGVWLCPYIYQAPVGGTATPPGWQLVADSEVTYVTGTWLYRTVRLGGLGANPDNDAWLAFRNYNGPTGDTQNWYIDDVIVQNIPYNILAYEDHALLTDSCSVGGSGDDNGYIEPGEDGTLSVTLRNTSDNVIATGITATLECYTAGVTITQPTAVFPDLPPGGSATSENAFGFHLDSTFPCGTMIHFSVTYTSNGGALTGGTYEFYLLVGSGTAGTPVPLVDETFWNWWGGTWPDGWWSRLDLTADTSCDVSVGISDYNGAPTAYSDSYMLRWDSSSPTGGGTCVAYYSYTTLPLEVNRSASISFYMYHDTASTANDRVEVHYRRLYGDTTWTPIGPEFPRYNGTTGWSQHTVDLSTLCDSVTPMYVGLACKSASGNSVFVDNVLIQAAPPLCDVCRLPCSLDSCDFTTTPAYGAAPLTVDLAASASYTDCLSVAYDWDFGDGNTGTGQNASHDYAAGGTYIITLTVTAEDQTCTATHSVTVCEIACSGSPSVTEGQAPLDVTFSSTVTVIGCTDPVACLWDFGDGTTFAGTNPTNTYAAGGTYAWTLTVTSGDEVCDGGGGTIQVCEINGCTATATPDYGAAPLTVNFAGAVDSAGCTGTPTWDWSFGDGGTSTDQNPVHQYAVGGTYSYSLTATIGLEQCTAGGMVTVCAVTNCQALATPDYGAAPLTVNFAGSADFGVCTGTPAWAWTFGDGATSNVQNPTHQYAAGGTYAYSLTVSEDGSSCTTGGTVTVCAVTNCSAIATPDYGAAPLTVNFAGSADLGVCTGTATWAWTFGDGGTSTDQNPVHQYAAGGVYTYSLTVGVDGSSCTTGGTVTVCQVQCTAAASTSSGLVPLAVNFTSTVDSGVCLDPVEYWWDFGDGATSAEANPSHTYTTGGTHTWTLTVTSGDSQCTQTGTMYADPYDLSFYDDLGRARLCANSVTGEFCWTVLSGTLKGSYAGVALRTTVPGLMTFSSPPWAPWQLLFRYYTGQKRGAGTFVFRHLGMSSALSDHLTTNNPAACD